MEEDHEELLQFTDDESQSENEDHCCSIENPTHPSLYPLTFFPHSKLQFFSCLFFLILSSTALLVILPFYIITNNSRGNVFSLMLVNVPSSTFILLVLLILRKLFCSKYKNLDIMHPPICSSKLLQLAFIYLCCGYLYFYGSDRNRVLCHLQDPIKGIVLVFALLYYFFFCRNLMGLHRIFSTTTVIVGLFIAVDYGLCDEFVCRGYDRQQVSDDAGTWPWKTHSIWTGFYILCLMLFAGFYTLLDRCIAPEYAAIPSQIISSSFLNTISSAITATTSAVESESQEASRRINSPRRKSAILLSFWIHLVVFLLVLVTFWIDFIPGVGKGDTVAHSLNYTLNGIMCYFRDQPHVDHDSIESNICGSLIWHALIFQLAYVTFVISSTKFLMLSQSAVFTIAAMSYALPVIGIWWSLFYASPSGVLVWSPKIRGEFVCSIIGLPIISLGLGLLCKAHFEDIQKPRNVMSRPANT